MSKEQEDDIATRIASDMEALASEPDELQANRLIQKIIKTLDFEVNAEYKTPEQMVYEFHEVFDCAINQPVTPQLVKLRINLMQEELDEFKAAETKVEMADALADLAYTVYGTAIAFGIPLDAVIEEVHRSNMSKLGADGKPIYRSDGKVLKGPDYSPPKIKEVLDEQAECRAKLDEFWKANREGVAHASEDDDMHIPFPMTFAKNPESQASQGHTQPPPGKFLCGGLD